MLIKKVELVKTAFKPGDYPEPVKREVAFAGRSNVGKSTLLNTLFQRKLAHTSSKPGKTRSINFYLVNSKYYFVDLPGYGFASASKQELARWKELIEDYFSTRDNLNLVTILMDSRHPMQKNDYKMLEWIKDYSIPFIVVLTKTDKLSGNELKKMIQIYEKELKLWCSPPIIPFSAKTRRGLNDLLKILIP